MESWIELIELFVGDTCNLCRDLQLDLAVSLDTSEIGLVGNRADGNVVGFRIRNETPHGQQLRYVRLRLLWKFQTPEVQRLALGAIRIQRALHIHLATVIGSNCQQPVAVELIVQ